ncbi:MAG TPA: VWA domain-containing protein [Acidimicrobiales bacterium]|nr:VWA domain-containing protein [Acidimicrobiales bacterium]
MTFLEPVRLWLALVVVAMAAAYVVLQVVGRRRYAVRFTNLALLGSVAPRRPGWRRHLPAALVLGSMLALVTSLAQPAREELVARERATIVLAIDVSISMDATDIAPSRFDAAKEAATSFTEVVPERINLGLVAFAGSASVLVPPTTDRDAVRAAIGRLELAEATAIGEAVLASLDAIRTLPEAEGAEPVPAHILVLSDGETTVGSPNEVAAEAARQAGVPVTTIAFGTPGGVIEYEGQLVSVEVNEQELAALADATGGSAFTAGSAAELGAVYDDIGSSIGLVAEDREIGLWFTAGAFALLLVAAGASLVWFQRLP